MKRTRITFLRQNLLPSLHLLCTIAILEINLNLYGKSLAVVFSRTKLVQLSKGNVTTKALRGRHEKAKLDYVATLIIIIYDILIFGDTEEQSLGKKLKKWYSMYVCGNKKR